MKMAWPTLELMNETINLVVFNNEKPGMERYKKKAFFVKKGAMQCLDAI